jgi:methylmalonyl-CoA mutase C-terminal domain/subunit
VLGLSILSGAVVPLTKRMVEALRERKIDDVLVVVGGIVPLEIRDELNALGVKGTFGPGTAMKDIIAFIRENVVIDRVY